MKAARQHPSNPACPHQPTTWRALSLSRFGSMARKRVHNADELVSAILAKRPVEHLERAGLVVVKKPTIGGSAALGRGHEDR
jgi:hypothetical protein